MDAKRILKPGKDFSFEKYLQEIYEEIDKIDEKEVNKMIANIKRFTKNVNLANTSPLLYVLDYTKSCYRMMSSNAHHITGYSAESFLDEGLELVKKLYQKDDFRIYNEKIFRNNTEFLKSAPREKHHQYIFSYNFRIEDPEGHLTSLHQRGFYLTSKVTGLPLFSIGTIQNIGSFKKDSVIYHNIEEVNAGTIKLIKQAAYHSGDKVQLISAQERRILQYIAEGKSSKQIGSILCISESIVITHRKNLLIKTNTINTAELIAYAIRKNIIS